MSIREKVAILSLVILCVILVVDIYVLFRWYI